MSRVPDQRLLLAVTGSVAAIKLPALLRLLMQHQVHVRVVVTAHACHFFDQEEVRALGVEILTDQSEWSAWKSLSDPVLHIELRKWADLMLIAPLDANTMAKMAAGMCDNLLTCVVRAWDMRKPLLICPAMNTVMWEHPATQQHLSQLSEWGYRQIPPVVKQLACGDYGCGGMADVQTIVQTVLTVLSDNSPTN
jgi:phosphopantothenoylcysteine decarboxylase